MSSTFDVVAQVISETSEIPRDQITPESHAIDDLGIDSLDFLDIVFAIDKEFGIKIPLEQWTQDVNDGKVATEEYFVLKNLCAKIDDLVAAFRPRAVPSWMTPRHRLKFAAFALIGRAVPPWRYPWGTFGPSALTYLAKKHGLFAEAQPVDVFYPYPHTRARWIFEPGGRIADILTERTVSVHLWNEKIREFKNMEPPSDSPLAELYRKFGV